MSAFTPYKKLRSEESIRETVDENEFARVRLPYDLTAMLLGLQRMRTETSEEEKKKKTEGFMMENLLRKDDQKQEADRGRIKEEVGRFNDHASRVETLVSNLGKSDHGHRCIYCGKVYSRKYGLKIHVRTHTGYKPLKCKYCARPFGDPSNLNKHVRLHAQGPSPYKCQFCEKLLVRRRDLERHVKSRHSNPT